MGVSESRRRGVRNGADVFASSFGITLSANVFLSLNFHGRYHLAALEVCINDYFGENCHPHVHVIMPLVVCMSSVGLLFLIGITKPIFFTYLHTIVAFVEERVNNGTQENSDSSYL